MFCRSHESARPGPSRKALRSLLLAAKSLYSFSDVCVRVGGVKSQTLNVGVGPRRGCVLSPLFLIHVNLIDRHSRVGEVVTVGSRRISRLPPADDIVLLVSSEQGL